MSAALARSLAVVALLLAALPLGAQVGPGVQHLQQQVRPASDTPVERPSPILAVVPSVFEPGDTVRIILRETLSGVVSPGSITVTIGGRLADIVKVFPDGNFIEVRAPDGLEFGVPLSLAIIGYGQRIFWDEPVRAISRLQPAPLSYYDRLVAGDGPTVLLLMLNAMSGSFLIMTLSYLYQRRRAAQLRLVAASTEAAAKEEVARLRFALDRQMQDGKTGLRRDISLAEAKGPLPPPEIPESLLKDLAAGQCALFWGSGLSAQAGYPTLGLALPELLSRMAGTPELAGLGLDQVARDKPDLAFDVILARLGEPATLEILKPFWDRERAPTDAMRQLADMPFANLVTSAWDRLPAQVFAGRKPLVLSRLDAESLAPLLRGDAFCVLHLWGAFDRGRVLLTEADYRATITDNPGVVRHIASLLQAQTHLFIGASLASIEQYLATAPPATGARQHYALVPEDPQIEAMREIMRSRYRLELLVFRPTPDWAGVPRFIEALRAKLGSTPPPARAAVVERLQIESVELENIGPFEKVRLELDPAWNLLLGDNGAGKSMVLRAIALGLCGDDTRALNEGARLLRNGTEKGQVLLTIGGTPYQTRLLRQPDGKVEVRPPTQLSPLAAGRWAVLGFPALRGVSGGNPVVPTQDGANASPRVEDVLPILSGEPDTRLRSLKQWLVNLEVGADAERAGPLRERFFAILNDFLPGLTIRYGGIDRESWTVHVLVNDVRIPIDQVSQGTGAMFGWVGALLLRLHQIHGDTLLQGGTAAMQRPAVVLIDEIDAHLHPAWQQRVVPALRRQFPEVQFIASTHSPLIVAELSQQQVFRMRRTNGAMLIDHPSDTLAGLGVSGLLTSDAFALTRVLGSHTQSLLERQRRLAAKEKLTAEDRQELDRLDAELSAAGFEEQIRDTVFAHYQRARERHLRRVMAEAGAEVSAEEAERLVAAALAEASPGAAER